MKKLTVIAAAIATMTALPSFANIATDSDSTTVSAVVYDLIKIEGLDNQLFLANDYVPGEDFTKVAPFRVARRGAWLGNALPFQLTIRQHGNSGTDYTLNGLGKPDLNLDIGVRDKSWGSYSTMNGQSDGVEFETRKGFISSGNNMQVQYTIAENDFLTAEQGGYVSRFVFTVAAL